MGRCDLTLYEEIRGVRCTQLGSVSRVQRLKVFLTAPQGARERGDTELARRPEVKAQRKYKLPYRTE